MPDLLAGEFARPTSLSFAVILLRPGMALVVLYLIRRMLPDSIRDARDQPATGTTRTAPP